MTNIKLSYEEKKQIADTYISELTEGFTWDDLPDINSLHDAETEADVKELCNERLADVDFPFDTLTEE